MELHYAGDDKLFVPLERLDLVQKYTGGASPPLDKLGGTSWEKAKTRVKKAMRDMAEELLKLYAARKAVAGHAFSPDAHWQQEFDDAFPYELTPDQRSAIADITRDLETSTPMDRLLCGDVGYGKTEVAMRAAFKVVMDGKQVAFLAPTTILAFQHLRTLTERFAGFPVRIDMISRFRTPTEQKAVLANLAAGPDRHRRRHAPAAVEGRRVSRPRPAGRGRGAAIRRGAQREAEADAEEGGRADDDRDADSAHAEHVARRHPRHVGHRDAAPRPPGDPDARRASSTPTSSRAPSAPSSNAAARCTSSTTASSRSSPIGDMVSAARARSALAVGHGQMSEEELERVMVDFIAHKFDVLLATTIVENGLDIPNANTLIVNRADRYGLAQLYQLRGRVGRSDRRAYAYLLIPTEETLSPIARRRLAAIREFSDLGSGFRIAALDLEIRGAGNLLGGEQSGHIEAIGFDMYVQLLDQTIRELKGEDLEDDRRAVVNLRLNLRLDESYVPDMNQRLMVYRRMASARTQEEVTGHLDELRDRYGRASGECPAPGRIRTAPACRPTGWASNGSTAKAPSWC